ncbi:hypothetical protein BDB01DRAFT_18263 [Pilobolus umbonatus]|nr:hypothetical protein BDB01DRAFT_18263 [Pilobolus umbonatus]
MVQILPNNYNNEHYKQLNFMNGDNYPIQNSLPPLPIVQQHQQQMPIPMPVPMINHLMPHPHHQPPGFFHPPLPPPQPIYPNDQPNQQYMDYGGFVPSMRIMQQGYYSDITVYIPTLQKSYALNKAFLSRSPVLYQRIIEEQPSTLELDLYVLPETFHTIIGHLYRPLSPQEILFLANEKPQIAIELLEASEELGLEPLLDAMLIALNRNLNHIKVAMTYIEAMEPYQPLEEEEPRHWVEALEEDVVSFMVRGLSTQLEAFFTSVKVSGDVTIGQETAFGYMPTRTPPMRGFRDLARAYANLPQHLMIKCLEHPELPVQDVIQRSYFVNEVLKLANEINIQRGRDTLMAVMKFEKGNVTLSIVKQTKLKKGRWDPSKYDMEIP